MRKPVRWYAVVGIMALVVVFAVRMWMWYIPRMQLTDQSISHLSIAIHLYINAHHKMPTGLAELEDAGSLQCTSSGLWETVVMPRVLYGMDNIEVNWQIDVNRICLVKDQLVYKDSGSPAFILRRRRAWWPGEGSSDRRCSIDIYRALLEAQSVSPGRRQPATVRPEEKP